MLTQYRCIIRTFFHSALRDPGDVVLCEPNDAEMKGNQCFTLVEEPKPEPEHIEPKKEKTAASPKQQPKKGTTK